MSAACTVIREGAEACGGGTGTALSVHTFSTQQASFCQIEVDSVSFGDTARTLMLLSVCLLFVLKCDPAIGLLNAVAHTGHWNRAGSPIGYLFCSKGIIIHNICSALLLPIWLLFLWWPSKMSQKCDRHGCIVCDSSVPVISATASPCADALLWMHQPIHSPIIVIAVLSYDCR